jgi:hypothetical protein
MPLRVPTANEYRLLPYEERVRVVKRLKALMLTLLETEGPNA